MAIGGGSGGGKSASDVRAGGAFYEVYAKDGLTGVLKNIEARVQRFAGSMRRVGGAMIGAGSALGALPFASLVQGVEKLSAIEDLTDIFGLTAEAASKMAYAFNVAGVETSELEHVFKELAKTNQSGKPLDEYLLDVADGLLAIEDPSERARTAIELLGKQGVNFLRVAGDLRNLNAEAPLFSMEQVKNAEAMKQAWEKIKISFAGALLPLFQYLAPMVKLVADFARENAGLLVVVGLVSTALIAFGAAAFVVGTAITGLMTVAGVIGSIFAAIVSPVGLVVAAIGVLGFALLSATVNWDDWLSTLSTTFQTAFGGIADAIKGGNLELAFEILSVAVQRIWIGMLQGLAQKLQKWLTDITSFISSSALGRLALGGLGLQLGVAGSVLLSGFIGDAERERQALQARLDALRKQAAAGLKPAEPPPTPGAIARAVEAVRGAFNVSRGNAAGQFGYGDTVAKKQLEFLGAIKDGTGDLPKAIGTAVGIAMSMH